MTNKIEKKIILIISLLSYFLTALSNSIVITGLTKISADLHLSQVSLAWVQNAFGLAFGSFILLSGKLGDSFGRRRVLNTALTIFIIGSLFTGLATNAIIIIIARFIQGIGAAIIAPTSMALLVDFFNGKELVKAIAWYSSISGLGSSIGLVLGGILASYWTWRIGFYLNVPVALIMILLSIKVLKKTKVQQQKFDIRGTILSILGSGLLVYAVNGAKNVPITLLIAVIVLVIFVLSERHNPQAIMPLSLFKNWIRIKGYVVRALLVGSMMGFWFFISEYLQDVLHYSPLLTGLGFLPMTLTMFIGAILVPRLVDDLGNLKVLISGAILILIGFIVIIGLANRNYWLSVALPMLFFGFGQGFALTPLTNLGIYHVPMAQSGVASAMVNTAHQLGSVLGLALMVSLSAIFAKGLATQFIVAMVVGLVISVVFVGVSFSGKEK